MELFHWQSQMCLKSGRQIWAKDGFEINIILMINESLIVDKISQDVCEVKRDRAPSMAFPFSS